MPEKRVERNIAPQRTSGRTKSGGEAEDAAKGKPSAPVVTSHAKRLKQIRKKFVEDDDDDDDDE
jgi:hypothetical protein